MTAPRWPCRRDPGRPEDDQRELVVVEAGDDGLPLVVPVSDSLAAADDQDPCGLAGLQPERGGVAGPVFQLALVFTQLRFDDDAADRVARRAFHDDDGIGIEVRRSPVVELRRPDAGREIPRDLAAAAD